MAATKRQAGDSLPTQEIFGKTVSISNPDLTVPVISYGLPFDQTVIKHLPDNARAYVIASKTLSTNTDNLERLKKALGDRMKGLRVGMTPHTIYQECLEVVADAKSVSADTLITLGAGSLADAAKFVCNALTNDFSSVEHLAQAAVTGDSEDEISYSGDSSRREPTARLILIPTSLSGGEHTAFSGITDRETMRKYQMYAKQADVTILDPWLCMSTPSDIWLQSGVRGIDHCVETLLSVRQLPEVVDSSSKGLELLIPGLLDCKRDTEGKNITARLNAQLGTALAILAVVWKVPCGGSHAIGHMLGPMGVGHGETSCILLPAVCKYNAEVKENRDRQAAVRKVLWGIPACEKLFVQEGLRPDKADLGDLLDRVIRALGMPRTLKEKGIEGEKVQQLAEMSLHDVWMKTNPRPLKSADEVMKILNEVRG